MKGEIDYFKKIDNITSKYFGVSLSDIPIPSKVFPINGKDRFLIGSKEALKEQYLVQGQIYKFLEYAPDGYFLTGFWGHGFNSYAFYYSRSDLKTKIFFRLPYGGAYTDNKREAKRIGKFLPEFFNFERNIKNDLKKLYAVDSMGTGKYQIRIRDQEIKCNNSIYLSKEDQFSKILKYLGIKNKTIKHGKPNKKSYHGKKFENMTPAEQEQYRKDRARRFTWEEGDIQVIGHETLTDEEKQFVKELKKKRIEDNKR